MDADFEKTTTPTGHDDTSMQRGFGVEVVAALDETPARWWCAAGVVAALAMSATLHDDVPLGAGLVVAVMTIAALADLRLHRLPDAIIAVAAAALLAGLAIERVAGTLDAGPTSVALGFLALAGPLLLLHLISPAAMGFGDVKAAAVLGAAIGAVEPQLAVVVLLVASALAVTVGAVRKTSTVPFGPALVAATAVVLVAHPIAVSDVATATVR